MKKISSILIQFLFFFFLTHLQAQTQIGADINGEASFDEFGKSVSISSDGSIIAIGSIYNEGNGYRSGHVRIYENTNGNWSQIGSDIDGENSNDQSGSSVSLSSDGSIVAIGAPSSDGSNGSNSGHVRVYQNLSGTWTQIGSDIDGETASDQSGSSVSLSSDGSIVAIGALYNNGNNNSLPSSGHVRVYQNLSGTWTQIGSDIDGETASDQSGSSVSLNADGTVVAIGAIYNDGAGSNSGHVRIYENTNGTWTKIGSDIDGEAVDDQSGSSISLSDDGNVVAIGARVNDVNGSYSGHVRIYKNNNGTWIQIGSDIDGEEAYDYFGTSVSLSSDGSLVAIGAPGASSGLVRIYQNTFGIWTQINFDINGKGNSDNLGTSVSLSDDGTLVAIGSPINADAGTNSGLVQVYKNNKSNWTQINTDIYGEVAGDRSGYSLSLSDDGTVIAIGSRENDGNGSDSGHVRIYQNSNGTWTQIGADIDGEVAGDQSGNSLSLSSDGSVVAIGSRENDGNGSYSGHVRIYQNSNGTWTQIGADIDGREAASYSGTSVSLSDDGTVVAIGASNIGFVSIYQNNNGTWTQVGTDIDSANGSDGFGSSVSLSSDGSIVAIGAPYNSTNGSLSGHVQIYKNISGTWTQIGVDINGEAANDRSGTSISLSSDGSVVAIGAYLNDGNGSDSGHVRIYQNSNGTWTQVLSDINGNETTDQFGFSVSLSADASVVAIGATHNYIGIKSFSGYVGVYKNPNFVKSKIGLDIDGEAAYDQSGRSVSVNSDGSMVAIGANFNDDNGSNSGHVRIYQNTNGTLAQIGDNINGEAADDTSGVSVSLSAIGSVVAIGASGNDDNGSNAGHVRVYQNLSGTWTQIGVDIDGEAEGDKSGTALSVSSDGSIVAIGARFNDGNGVSSGHVRVYQNMSGTWTQIGVDINGKNAGDQSGSAVSLSSDGSIIAISAPSNDNNGSNSGQVRVYQNMSGTWTQIGSKINGEAAGDESGGSVSLSSDGSIIAIGAHLNDGNGTDAGHVRIYKNNNGTWTQIGSDIDGEVAGDQFGVSVALSSDGSLVTIGASLNDGNGTESGSVRVYKNINNTWTQIRADIDGEAAGDKSGTALSVSSDGTLVAIGSRFNSDNGSNSGHVRLYLTGQIVWQGDDNNDWENLYNWQHNVIPQSNDYVVIPNGISNLPTAINAITANTIEINNGATFKAASSVSSTIHYMRDLATTDWYMVTSPVSNQDIDAFASSTSLASGSNNNNNRGLASYNNSTGGWDYYQSDASNSGNFIQGQGYTIKLTEASTLNFRGTMNDTNTSATINKQSNAFNLVGNPFLSYVSINSNASDTTENLLTINKATPDSGAVLEESTLWFWDQENGYKAVNLASTDLKYIAPGQGFFVKTSATTGNSATLSFTKAMQSHQTTDTFLKTVSSRPEIKLKVTNNGITKATDVFYINGTTTGFDNGYDSSIFEGANTTFVLYTGLVTGDVEKKLAIQSLPDTNLETMVIPVGIILNEGEIEFSANAVNLPSKTNKVYLEDKELGIYKRLDDGGVYNVTLKNTSSTEGRFFLHVKSEVLSITTPDKNISSVNIFYSSNTKELHVNGLINSETSTIQVYNVLGKEVFSKSFISKPNNTLMLPKLNKGVYVVLFNNTKGKASKKIVIE